MRILDIFKSTDQKILKENEEKQKLLEYRRCVTNMNNEQLIMFTLSQIMYYVGYNEEDSIIYEQLCKRSGMDMIYE